MIARHQESRCRMESIVATALHVLRLSRGSVKFRVPGEEVPVASHQYTRRCVTLSASHTGTGTGQFCSWGHQGSSVGQGRRRASQLSFRVTVRSKLCYLSTRNPLLWAIGCSLMSQCATGHSPSETYRNKKK